MGIVKVIPKFILRLQRVSQHISYICVKIIKTFDVLEVRYTYTKRLAP